MHNFGRYIKFRHFLLSVSLPGVLLAATPAGAQTIATVRDLLPTASPHAHELLGQGEPADAAAPAPVAVPLGTPQSFELDDITVTASLRARKLKEVPGSIYVITRQEMEQKGARTVGDALQGVPGVVSNLAGPGANVNGTYFIRGLPTTSTALLIDGRPYNNLNQEFVDLNELPVANVERIEVLTSGATTLYGGTAVGGAINVITRRPPQVFGGTAEINFGSYGYSDYRLSFGGPIADNLRFNLFADTFSTVNDYTYRVERPDGQLFTGKRLNGDFNNDNYGLDVDWDIDERTALTFSSYYRRGARGLSLFAITDPRTQIPVEDGSFPSATEIGLNNDLLKRVFINYYGFALNLDRKLGATDNSTLQLRFSYDRGLTREVDAPTDPDAPPGEIAFDATDIGVFDARVLHDWQIAPAFNLTYGFDFLQEGGNAFAFDNPLKYEASIAHPSLFALATLRPTDDLVFTFGLRGTFGTRSNARDFSRDFEGSFDPSVGARWQALPQLALRGTFSRVFKTPNFNDLYGFGELQGNPDLVPERGSTFDLGFDWQPGSTSLVRFSYFYNDIQNLLSYDIIEPGFPQDAQLQEKFGLAEGDRLRVNYPSVRSSGFEMSANWQFVPGWTLFATETYTDARVVQGFKQTLTQTQYPLVPFHSGRAGVSYKSPGGFQAALFANFQGLRSVDTVHIGPPFAQEPDPNGAPIAHLAYLPPGTLLPGFATLDLSFRLPLSERAALLGFLNNLTGVAYERYYGNGGPPLNFKVGLQYNF